MVKAAGGYPVTPEAPDAPDDFYAVLLAMTGHDLRNQLQVIESAHRALERHMHSDKEKFYLEHGKSAAAHVSRQLEAILEALRLYRGGSEVPLRATALLPLLVALGDEMTGMASRKNIELQISAIDASVLSNANLLSAILRNLIQNAIKYTPKGGRVSVDCHRHGRCVRTEVTDDGIGIAPEHLSRIFDAFHQIDATRSDGLGLGLFIARRAAILLRHGIEVKSRPGQGSQFALVADLVGST